MSKVDELREELRRGRNETDDSAGESPDGSSFDIGTDSGSFDREERTIPLDLHRPDTENDSVNGSYNDSERSIDEIIIGKRSANRRSGESGSSSIGSAETVRGPKRRRGRLEADDAIPIRIKAPSKGSLKGSGSRSISSKESEIGPKPVKELNEEKGKPVQRGKETPKNRGSVSEGEGEKQGISLPKFKFKEGSTLSLTEAKALEAPLLSALESDFYYLDQYIWYRTQDPTQAPIWSDMDNEDLVVLTKVMIQRGQKSPATASIVRGIVNGSTYVDVAMLMGPRFVRTVQALKNAPKIERPSILDRKRMARGLS